MFGTTANARSTGLLSTTRVTNKTEVPDFQAVILCGYGMSLEPLTEKGLPKALLPIGDTTMIDRVLEWIEVSGIIDVLLLCPPTDLTAITNHLRVNWSSSTHQHYLMQPTFPPSSSKHSEKDKENLHPRSRLRIEAHSLEERAEKEVDQPPSGGMASSSSNTLQRTSSRGINIPSLSHAPKTSLSGFHPSEIMGVSPGSRVDSHLSASLDDEELVYDTRSGKIAGTGRILRRWRDWITSDFVVLPCDISPPPGLTLKSLLDRHRTRVGSILTSLWYEPSDTERKDEFGPEPLMVAYDKHTEDLLMIEPLEKLKELDDLDLRMSLLRKHSTLSITTKLIDAHVYVMRRSVLDLMMTKDPKDLSSLREDLLPWLVKGTWQTGLREKWMPILNTKPDPLATAIAKSTRNPYSTTVLPTQPKSTLSVSASAQVTQPPSPSRQLTEGQALLDFKSGLSARDASDARARRAKKEARTMSDELRANLMIWKAPAPPAEEAPKQQQQGGKVKGGKAPLQQQSNVEKAKPEPERPLMRGNTVATYWELNRQFLRLMPPNFDNLPNRGQPPPTPTSAATAISSTSSVPPPNIDPRAQISPDSLVAESTRIAERSSVKKSIIGRHCVIGKNVKINGCILWDFVTVADGAKLENTILCSNIRVEEKAQVRDCELGAGYVVHAEANLKGQRGAGDD